MVMGRARLTAAVTATVYRVWPVGETNALADAATTDSPEGQQVAFIVPKACTLKNFRCRMNVSVATANITVTVRKNIADTTVSVAFANPAEGDVATDTDSVSFAAGDRLSLSVTHDAGANRNIHPSWAFELAES